MPTHQTITCTITAISITLLVSGCTTPSARNEARLRQLETRIDELEQQVRIAKAKTELATDHLHEVRKLLDKEVYKPIIHTQLIGPEKLEQDSKDNSPQSP